MTMAPQPLAAGTHYTCPMHPEVDQTKPGKCPTCGMDLLPEGTRFPMLRHMASGPMPFIAGGVVALALIAIAMLWN